MNQSRKTMTFSLKLLLDIRRIGWLTFLFMCLGSACIAPVSMECSRCPCGAGFLCEQGFCLQVENQGQLTQLCSEEGLAQNQVDGGQDVSLEPMVSTYKQDLLRSTKPGEWLLSFGGSGDERVMDITVHGDAVYAVGYVSGGARLYGQAISVKGGKDLFVAKFTKQGKLVWLQIAGSEQGDEEARYVRVSGKGAVFVGGSFREPFTWQGKKVGEPPRREDSFLVRLRPDGSLVWASSVLDVSSSLTLLTLSRQGALFVGGTFFGVSEKITETEKRGYQCFVMQVDPETGRSLWGRSLCDFREHMWGCRLAGLSAFSTSGGDRRLLALMRVTGRNEMPAPSCEIQCQNQGKTSLALLAMDATDGSFLWDMLVRGGKEDPISFEPFDIIVEPSSKGVYVLGAFLGAFSLPSATASIQFTSPKGLPTVMLMRFDLRTRAFLWARKVHDRLIRHPFQQRPRLVLQPGSEMFWVAGQFSLFTLACDGQRVTARDGEDDVYWTRWSPSGSCSQAMSSGGSGDEAFGAFTIDERGSRYLGGSFRSKKADFGSFMLERNQGFEDVFLWKLPL